jgi:predicted AlkP superfamily phosphohydrolase/phosphomutase
MPTIPGVLYIATGMDPGQLGIYGPTYKSSYTRDSKKVDLSQYSYDGAIYVPPPPRVVHMEALIRDRNWGHKAWAEAGSWGMVYLNVRARQKDGIICPTKFHEARDDLIKMIGRYLPEVTVYKTEELWDCTGVPPDLLVRWDGYEFDEVTNVDNWVEDY